MEPDLAIDDLDAAATLSAVEAALVMRRAAEARELALAAHWADLHASDPQLGPGGQRNWQGEDRLIDIGGEGTPRVQELCISELAVARRVHHHSARAAVADALDLRHRVPHWWDAVQTGGMEPWVARKVAVLSRPLSEIAVRLVDDCLPDDLGEFSPSRVFDVVRAKIIEADPQRHRDLLDAAKKKRYVSLCRIDEFGLQHILARVRAGDAVWIDAMIERIADLIAPRYDSETTRDVLRSEAFTWLARPAELLDLLSGGTGDAGAAARPRAVLYLHLHEEAVRKQYGVARVEDLCPILSRDIPEWLGHAHVTVKPVIDLTDSTSFDAYEHPSGLAERVTLRSPADTFPHANRVSRRLDLDHVDPYVRGKPGQTGDHNSQPLARTSHRAKTHRGHRVRQLGPGVYVWRTPHGLTRLVDHRGTTVLPHGMCDHLFADPAAYELAV